MSNCINKIKNKCGTILYSECVSYEEAIPEFSNLFEEGCLNISETTGDIYTLIGEMKEEINLTDLEGSCITFTEPKTVTTVVTQLYNKMCELEATILSQSATITNLTARIVSLEANPCT